MLSFRAAFVGGEVESADYAGLQAAALPLGSFRRCMAAQPHLERRLSQEIEALYEMITTRGAVAMNLRGYGLEVGCPANLVVLDQASVTESLRFHAAPAAVISHGRLVDLERMRGLAQPSR
jgi:cytosine/adenosine deaminase-related metal-dependent hydrolase